MFQIQDVPCELGDQDKLIVKPIAFAISPVKEKVQGSFLYVLVVVINRDNKNTALSVEL